MKSLIGVHCLYVKYELQRASLENFWTSVWWLVISSFRSSELSKKNEHIASHFPYLCNSTTDKLFYLIVRQSKYLLEI